MLSYTLRVLLDRTALGWLIGTDQFRCRSDGENGSEDSWIVATSIQMDLELESSRPVQPQKYRKDLVFAWSAA
jgi:hypothetical protein